MEFGLTQEIIRVRIELHDVYISRTQYSRIEVGDSILKATEVIALAEVLGRSCDWLLGYNLNK
ncbi:MAG: helix-turn-helix transcriptional regulator [Herpetosiphonaceae bacterium]|nr:helix-turn-helix transcriptional regulator [Herpetosiphonaceae bacterium]